MILSQTLFNVLIACQCGTFLLLATPFPVQFRKIVLYISTFIGSLTSGVAGFAITSPFLDSLQVLFTTEPINGQYDATVLLNFYKGLIVGILVLILFIQRLQVKQILNLNKQLTSAKLNLEATVKQAKSASAQSLRMVDELAAAKEGKPGTKKLNDKDDIEAKNKELTEELRKAKLDLDTVKKQSLGMEVEYQRLADELESVKLNSDITSTKEDFSEGTAVSETTTVRRRRTKKAD